MMAKRVLVTAALPYANGSIHLGHMLEAVQTDVYVRARKLAGDDCRFMWADDTHGTPIQVRARKEGITPEEVIERAYAEHRADFTDFQIGFDVFHSTHTEESKKHVTKVFEALRDSGNIASRSIDQLYCPHDEMFLPDRFVKGTCPKCKSPEQYGDNCEVCGSTYNPTDLSEPHCSLCGTTPVLKASEHLFVDLARHGDFLREWIASGGVDGGTPLQSSQRNYVMEWVEGGLRDWDISRDAPYFGWEIPGNPGKYFYVWFDAPIGYIGATQKWCDDNGADVDDYWGGKSRDDVELVHVIGKDIVYFHCLFWPAMLNAAGYTTPSKVQVHGWLTVGGEKMSKTRGTFILARTYLEHLPSDYMRYYFAAKVGSKVEDIDLSFEDFVNRCNAELVKKAANLCSRSMKFVFGRLGGTLGELPADTAEIVAKAQERLLAAQDHFLAFESPKALRLAMEVAEDFNLYITEKEPWKLAKTDPEAARGICSAGIYASQVIATILAPVLPTWAEKMQRMLKLDAPLTFATGGQPLAGGHAVAEYETLAEPIDAKAIEAIVEASKEDAAPKRTFDYEVEELAAQTKIDAFDAVDLRVGKVLSCEKVPKADKLLQLTIDLGPLGMRNIFSGIAKSYAPEDLVGKHVAVFANLKPRKMRFGMSEGMVLASGESDDSVTVLKLDPRSKPGEKIT